MTRDRVFPFEEKLDEQDIKVLVGRVTFNSAGTTCTISRFRHVTSIARTATGKWTLTLDKKWNSVWGVKVEFGKTTVPDVVGFIDRSTLANIDADVKATTPIIKLGFHDTSFGYVDPKSCVAIITLRLKESDL